MKRKKVITPKSSFAIYRKKRCADIDKILDSIIKHLETHPERDPTEVDVTRAVTVDDISGYTALALDEFKSQCPEEELERFHDVFMYATIKRINEMSEDLDEQIFDKGFEGRYKALLDKPFSEIKEAVAQMNKEVKRKGEGWQFRGLD